MRAWLLDISRSLSRVGLGAPTGIDRVELAYIRHLLQAAQPGFFLCRVAGGFAIIDRAAMQSFLPVLRGQVPPGRIDLIGHIAWRIPPLARAAQSAARRAALVRCAHNGLAAAVRRILPDGFAYLNVGHSNQDPAVWAQLRAAGAAPLLALAHDTIPLDYPAFTRAGQAHKFEIRLRAAAAGADAIICNSVDTQRRLARWLSVWGMNTPLHVALLGADPLPATAWAPVNAPSEFVVLGTIEPRKNHALLLDVWAQLRAPRPQLHIIGRRGWENDAVFARLDAVPKPPAVFEHNHLDDTQLAQRMSRARALLFPSFAEGFGFPVVEALQMGVPVICSDIPVFRELAGDAVTYLPADRPEIWAETIAAFDKLPPPVQRQIDFPDWASHFSIINQLCD